jgi:hypothetical protein
MARGAMLPTRTAGPRTIETIAPQGSASRCYVARAAMPAWTAELPLVWWTLGSASPLLISHVVWIAEK